MTKSKFFKKVRQLVLILGLIFVAGYVGYRVGAGKRSFTFIPPVSERETIDLSEFWLVWAKLEEKYLDKDKLDVQKMVQGAISGMVDSLGDPYTVYLPPEDKEITQQNLTGSFGGIGIQLGFKDGQLAVISPLKQTPAERAGIEAGDLILRIKDENKDIDQSTDKITLPEAVKLIRGEIGSEIKLTLFRDSVGEPFEVTIVRAEIEIPSIEISWEKRENIEFAHVHILNFSELMKTDWLEWVEEVKNRKNNPQFGGVVLDLRNNPGGYLDGAVFVAGEFLEKGKTIVWQEDYQGNKQKYNIQRQGELLEVPLVILVNAGTASASEILAGALSHYQRAELVGLTTFGKGTIQQPEDLPDGSGLHITTARWLLPNEVKLDDEGLEPDIIVEIDQIEDLDEDEDPILEESFQVLINSQ